MKWGNVLDYYFSGGLTQDMVDVLVKMPDYEPIDVLVSQLDRTSIKEMLKHQEDGIIRKLFIDSGAYSAHTRGVKLDVDEYIDFINSIDEHIHAVAQVDTIPGRLNQPKSKEDYEEGAEKSWENFLYMYPRMKSPEKLIPVFHSGESFDALKRMLEWKDDNGNHLTYIGIAPAKDISQSLKNRYMQNVYDLIAASSNPNVRTHLFGMTSLDALPKFPAYSADSTSHRHMGAYNKVLIPGYGVLSISQRTRARKGKGNMSWLDCKDEYTMKPIKDYIEGLGFTIQEASDSPAVRTAISMYSIMKILKENPYKPTNVKRSKKLFDLPK